MATPLDLPNFAFTREVGRALLALAVFAALFSKHGVIAGVSFGELLVCLVVLVVLCRAALAPNVIVFDTSFLALLALALVVILGSLAHVVESTSDFSVGEFSASALKLLLGFISLLVISTVIRAAGSDGVRTAMLFVLTVSACLGAYVTIAVITRALPYEFLWIGQQGPADNVFFRADQSLVRMRGIFSEPSLFGGFHALGIGYLLLSRSERPGFWHVAINFLAVMLSFSLTAYGLLIVVLTLYFTRSDPRRTIPLVLGLVLVGAVGWYFAAEIFSRAIVARVGLVAAGSDISGMARLIATWELPLWVMQEHPAFGTGLGNLDIYFQEVGSRLRFERILAESPQGWNVFAYVLGSLGVLGLLVFLFFVMDLFRTAGRIAAVWVAYMFTTGALLEPTFWVFHAIFLYGSQDSQHAE